MNQSEDCPDGEANLAFTAIGDKIEFGLKVADAFWLLRGPSNMGHNFWLIAACPECFESWFGPTCPCGKFSRRALARSPFADIPSLRYSYEQPRFDLEKAEIIVAANLMLTHSPSVDALALGMLSQGITNLLTTLNATLIERALTKKPVKLNHLRERVFELQATANALEL